MLSIEEVTTLADKFLSGWRTKAKTARAVLIKELVSVTLVREGYRYVDVAELVGVTHPTISHYTQRNSLKNGSEAEREVAMRWNKAVQALKSVHLSDDPLKEKLLEYMSHLGVTTLTATMIENGDITINY